MRQSSGQIWNWNKRQEMKSIRDCLKRFRYIAIDTEFPGCLKDSCDAATATVEEVYKDLKFNVDNTKLIQLGFTLFDDEGRIGGTWEVNFSDFDETKDLSNVKSIAFLKRNGLNLKKIRDEGVTANEFFRVFAHMVKEKEKKVEIGWVTFQGLYDLAYLVKGITGRLLPETFGSYLELTKILFPDLRDVKEMAGEYKSSYERFGLQRLANKFGIKRFGHAHHAGSDSELTARIFSKLDLIIDEKRIEDRFRIKDELKMQGCYEEKPQPVLTLDETHEIMMQECYEQQPPPWINSISPIYVEHHLFVPYFCI